MKLIFHSENGGSKMFINIERDYDKTLKQQIKEGTSQGWEYMGCFGNCYSKVLKFLKLN